MVQTLTSEELRTHLLKALKLRRRQRGPPRVCLCPGVYGDGGGQKQLFNFTEAPYLPPNVYTLKSHAGESLLQETRF